jgi:hypothetical protein
MHIIDTLNELAPTLTHERQAFFERFSLKKISGLVLGLFNCALSIALIMQHPIVG